MILYSSFLSHYPHVLDNKSYSSCKPPPSLSSIPTTFSPACISALLQTRPPCSGPVCRYFFLVCLHLSSSYSFSTKPGVLFNTSEMLPPSSWAQLHSFLGLKANPLSWLQSPLRSCTVSDPVSHHWHEQLTWAAAVTSPIESSPGFLFLEWKPLS